LMAGTIQKQWISMDFTNKWWSFISKPLLGLWVCLKMGGTPLKKL
jgi:hypothetical protein